MPFTAATGMAVLFALCAAVPGPGAPARGADDSGNPPVRLTLEQALALAEEQSPELAEYRALLRAGEAGEALARASRMPDLDVSARASKLSDVPEYAVTQPDGSREVIFPNIPERYGAAIDLRVPLYTGGRIRWERTAAEWRTAAAGGDLAAAAADLRLRVTDAYCRVVLAGEEEKVYAGAIEAFEAHIADVEQRMRFGLAARNDLLAVQVQRDRAHLARLEAARDRAVAAAALVRRLGLAPGSAIEVAPLPDSAGGDGAGLSPLIDEALAARPERAALAARVEAAKAATERERAERLPVISAGAGYEYSRPNMLIIPPVDEFNDTWDLSLNLTYRFWDGGKRRARIERAEREAEAVERRLETFDRTVGEQVTAAWHDLSAARAAVPVSGTGLASAEENLKVAGDRYREGLLASSELLDAEVALLEAGLACSAAAIRVRLAEARLERVLGR